MKGTVRVSRSGRTCSSALFNLPIIFKWGLWKSTNSTGEQWMTNFPLATQLRMSHVLWNIASGDNWICSMCVLCLFLRFQIFKHQFTCIVHLCFALSNGKVKKVQNQIFMTCFCFSHRYTLSTSNSAIAALLCALYPHFPAHSTDNR